MKIEFSSHDKPEEWIASIARQLKVPLNVNSIELPGSIGEGFIKHFYLFPGLTLSYMRLKLCKPIEFIRKPMEHAKLIPVMFYSNDLQFEQYLDGKQKPIGYHTPNGIFMPSPQIQSRWFVPGNFSEFQITLSFDREWLLASLDSTKKRTFLRKILQTDKPFYLFESITPSILRAIRSIDEIITKNNTLQNLELHQKAMELLTLFLQKVEQREIVKDAAKLNASDIEKIFQTRKQLLESLHYVPPLKQLASNAAMSVSKLQKCFRQVFGKSIMQYALYEKMQLAKQLLDSKKYSVSEVGYQVGYSNLSHFTEAFKNEFGINPKAYRNSNP
ncbi:MAG: AraC family transcriptional regulator [Ignavibacteria bacterium]|jgi:AraC-like DNA-binding protein